MKIVSTKDAALIAEELALTNNRKAKAVLVHVLAERNATNQFEVIANLLDKADAGLKRAIYRAIPSVSTEKDLMRLMKLLSMTEEEENINAVQQALVKVLGNAGKESAPAIYNAFGDFEDKSKLIPVLPALRGQKALTLISERMQFGNNKEKKAAILALAAWKGNESLPYLFKAIVSSKKDIWPRYL